VTTRHQGVRAGAAAAAWSEDDVANNGINNVIGL
jgi:hypothetical protein